MVTIKGITSYSITEVCERSFDVENFRECAPAYEGNSDQEFYDYLYNIDDYDEFLYDNEKVLTKENYSAVEELFYERDWGQYGITYDSRDKSQDYDWELI